MLTLAAEDVHKRFGAVRALRGVTLNFHAGEIHGLAGANGSGKSTLLNILSGQFGPDSGRVLLGGGEVSFRNPSAALDAGIAIVTQEMTLVPARTVAENVLLGRRRHRRWFGVDQKAMGDEASEVLARLGSTLDVTAPVSALRTDERQLVEIARAMAAKPDVLILDEPTSALTEDEVTRLTGTMNALKEQGVAIIFVTHRMKEVFSIVDRLSVLRDGQVVGSGPIEEYDADRLVVEMAGERPTEFKHLSRTAASRGRAMLDVQGLTMTNRLRNVNLQVGEGEIVGLAGLVGAGRSELLEALFGLHGGTLSANSVTVGGEPIGLRSVAESVSRGLALVPGDRKRTGLVLDMSVEDNLLMSKRAFAPRLRPLRRAQERVDAAARLEELKVKTSSPQALVSTLSGGNQQKVVLGRWLSTSPRLFLLDEPTRGVDAHSKTEIYRLLHAARESGISMLVSSSETPELLTLCDRILVMAQGEVVADLAREDASEAAVTHYASGFE